ncbi:hypothetical protein MRB53_037764 [Persea americana]|nr:hypothetical protein MRB53_037764 [Persea americana]
MAVTRKRKAEAEDKSAQSNSGENKSSKKAKKELKTDESKQNPEPEVDKKHEEKKDEQTSDTITINRAPVLELWSACLTQSRYPDLPWSTCLSVGGAISTLCAISKGRAIGAIDKPDEETAEKRRQERESKTNTDEVDVMHFNIKLEKGVALVGSKPKESERVCTEA